MKFFKSVTSHALGPPPSPCHKLSHLLGPPPPLERDVLYGRSLTIISYNHVIFIYCCLTLILKLNLMLSFSLIFSYCLPLNCTAMHGHVLVCSSSKPSMRCLPVRVYNLPATKQ